MIKLPDQLHGTSSVHRPTCPFACKQDRLRSDTTCTAFHWDSRLLRLPPRRFWSSLQQILQNFRIDRFKTNPCELGTHLFGFCVLMVLEQISRAPAIHEAVGSVERLRLVQLHHSFPNITSMLKKTRRNIPWKFPLAKVCCKCVKRVG